MRSELVLRIIVGVVICIAIIAFYTIPVTPLIGLGGGIVAALLLGAVFVPPAREESRAVGAYSIGIGMTAIGYLAGSFTGMAGIAFVVVCVVLIIVVGGLSRESAPIVVGLGAVLAISPALQQVILILQVVVPLPPAFLAFLFGVICASGIWLAGISRWVWWQTTWAIAIVLAASAFRLLEAVGISRWLQWAGIYAPSIILWAVLFLCLLCAARGLVTTPWTLDLLDKFFSAEETPITYAEDEVDDSQEEWEDEDAEDYVDEAAYTEHTSYTQSSFRSPSVPPGYVKRGESIAPVHRGSFVYVVNDEAERRFPCLVIDADVWPVVLAIEADRIRLCYVTTTARVYPAQWDRALALYTTLRQNARNIVNETEEEFDLRRTLRLLEHEQAQAASSGSTRNLMIPFIRNLRKAYERERSTRQLDP